MSPQRTARSSSASRAHARTAAAPFDPPNITAPISEHRRAGRLPSGLVTVRIVTDSACDLPQAAADELGIEIVPLSIRFGDEEFIDRRDLTVAEFWRRSAASPVLPETAAPPPGAFEQTYRELMAAGATGIVVISLSGGLSATLQSAELAARAVADEVSIAVVDSQSCTLGLGTIVAATARAARDGATFDDARALAADLASRTKVWG